MPPKPRDRGDQSNGTKNTAASKAFESPWLVVIESVPRPFRRAERLR
jgi:hypothetical protein